MQVWPQLVNFPQAMRLCTRSRVSTIRASFKPRSRDAHSCMSLDWPASDRQVAVVINVAGALATQLQGDGCQMFSSSLHDQFAHHAVAGVKDVVEPLPQQFLGLRNAPGYYRVKFLIDTERDDLSSNVGKFFDPIDKNNSPSSCYFTIKAWLSNKEWQRPNSCF